MGLAHIEISSFDSCIRVAVPVQYITTALQLLYLNSR